MGPGMSGATRTESVRRALREIGKRAHFNAGRERFAAGGECYDMTSVIRAPQIFLPVRIALLVVSFLLSGGPVNAQSTAKPQDRRAIRAVDGDGKPYPLPAPPEEIAKLIEQGNVSFEFYDPKIVTRSFAGETKFEFRYAYQSRSNWQRVTQDGKPAIEVRIEYQDISLEREHRVLLPQEMMADDLFTRRLTLHEFDHVRISCDPRLPELLKSMLIDRNSRIVQVLDEEQHEFKDKPNPKDLARIGKQIVKDESDRVFNDFVSIVSIRYQELDRVSNYGLQPLSPEDRDRIIDSPPQPPRKESEPAGGPSVQREPFADFGPAETSK
jgi:hypothetical protein